MKRWFVAVSLVACGQPVPGPTRPPPSPLAPALDAAPPPPVADVMAALAGVATRVTQELAQQYPVADDEGLAERAEIAAIGPCTRPTAAERKELAARITKANREADSAALRFGCVDPGGTIVDVSYDRPNSRNSIGVWRVVRVARDKVTTLAEYVGTSTNYWSEWANEVTLATLALVDLDGDGNHDAILAEDQHEGGSQAHDVTISSWSSSTDRATTLGTGTDSVALARGQPAEHLTSVVVRIDSHREALAPRYRCAGIAGALELCPAIEEARRVDRAVELATWYANGTFHVDPSAANAPAHLPDKLDRELLADQLETLHVSSADQAPLLASVPPTPREIHVARAIADALADRAGRKFGEPIERAAGPDPRAPQLAALLGDTACPATPKPAATAAIAAMRAWVVAHDRPALVEHGDCPATGACRWKRVTPPEIGGSCMAGATGYFSVRWTYVDGQDIVARDGLFYLDRDHPKLIAAATSTGQQFPCSACGTGPPAPQLDIKLHRHGRSLVALILGVAGVDKPRRLAIAVDGALTTVAPSDDVTSWYGFGELGVDGTPVVSRTADDLVQVTTLDGRRTFWHWDRTWSSIVSFDEPTLRSPPPATNPAGLWLWEEARRAVALQSLYSFDSAQWAQDDDYRADVTRALTLVGADPSIASPIVSLDGAK